MVSHGFFQIQPPNLITLDSLFILKPLDFQTSQEGKWVQRFELLGFTQDHTFWRHGGVAAIGQRPGGDTGIYN